MAAIWSSVTDAIRSRLLIDRLPVVVGVRSSAETLGEGVGVRRHEHAVEVTHGGLLETVGVGQATAKVLDGVVVVDPGLVDGSQVGPRPIQGLLDANQGATT